MVGSLNRSIWGTVYRTTAINLALLISEDLLVSRGYLPSVWTLRGVGAVMMLVFAGWTAMFIRSCAYPFSRGMRMVLTEKIHRIDYWFLMGIAYVTISYYALVLFHIVRIDPGGIQFMSNSSRAADLLYYSTLAFLSSGFDVMQASSWWGRLVLLSEELMGLGYLGGLLALLTNRLASEPPSQ